MNTDVIYWKIGIGKVSGRDSVSSTGSCVIISPMQMRASTVSKLSVTIRGRQEIRHVPKIPDFNGSVFASSHQPLSFAVERHGCHVPRVTFERDELSKVNEKLRWRGTISYRFRGCRGNFIYVDLLVNGCGEQALTGKAY